MQQYHTLLRHILENGIDLRLETELKEIWGENYIRLFFEDFNNRLYGHSKFKSELIVLLLLTKGKVFKLNII